MQLSAQVKLLPTPEQAALLKQTLERANAACNAISEYAWGQQTFGRNGRHHTLYYAMREQFDLGAQMTVQCLSKVIDAYQRDHQRQRQFRALGSIAYDDRMVSFRIADRAEAHVSIWTLTGREVIPLICGDHHWRLLQTQAGESRLVYRNGQFYLHATCEVEEQKPQSVDDTLGVDLGIVNLAVDSDDETYTAQAHAHINTIRHRYRKLRQKLQKKGTKAAKCLLKKRAGRERRFAQNTNHVISKRIVAKAQGTGRAIALEDLTGIRARVTVSRPQRATLHSWSFHDLREKITYKAHRAGIPVILVDPRNTSRTCPQCGYVSKRNRPSQSTFACVQCGFAGRADHIAAINIGRRAAVTRPDVSDAGACPSSSGG